MERQGILQQALKLSPNERAELVEQLLKTLDEPDPSMDAWWVRGADARLKAYDAGQMGSTSLDEVKREFIDS